MKHSDKAKLSAITLLNTFAKKLKKDNKPYSLIHCIQIFTDKTLHRQRRFGFYGFLNENLGDESYEIGASIDWLVGTTNFGNDNIVNQDEENYKILLDVFKNFWDYLDEDNFLKNIGNENT